MCGGAAQKGIRNRALEKVKKMVEGVDVAGRKWTVHCLKTPE
jgi:hypothetical protein